jgi:hypothetical protein
MVSHFLFESGEWLGAGQVTFTMSPDLLYFRTKWSVAKQEDATFLCSQTVEIIGGDSMLNVFSISPTSDRTFGIVLSNEVLGEFMGTGIVEPEIVAWEFRDVGTFEGYEVYERTQEDEYSMHAEYLSSDGARTMIRGKIWRKRNSIL